MLNGVTVIAWLGVTGFEMEFQETGCEMFVAFNFLLIGMFLWEIVFGSLGNGGLEMLSFGFRGYLFIFKGFCLIFW